MTVNALVDTNVLVYGYDATDLRKHACALALVAHRFSSGEGAVSTQVLAEFFVTVTAKIPKPLDRTAALAELRRIAAGCAVLELHARTVLQAVEQGMPQGLSFWDALIWATAREHDLATIYTEDFQHGRTIDGVRLVNPFATAP